MARTRNDAVRRLRRRQKAMEQVERRIARGGVAAVGERPIPEDRWDDRVAKAQSEQTVLATRI
jgi:hypothetical protein